MDIAMNIYQALLERHGPSFGRDHAGWRIVDADLHNGALGFALSDASGQTARATLTATHDASGRLIEAVDGPFGTWQFVSPTNHASPWSDAWQDTVRALLAMDFEPHDAVCLARAWQKGDRLGETHWPTQLTHFPAVTLTSAPLPATCIFPSCPERLGLYVVVPDAAWIERLVPLGVPTLQLRFKSDNADEVAEQIARAERATRGSDCRLFINDHWHEAIRQHHAGFETHCRSGIYGIHLGQEDLADADVSAIAAAQLRLGVSTHGFSEMLRVLPLQPSYLALGAVFPTTTKTLKTAPQGLARLQAYVETIRSHYSELPLVAIGGIDLSNIEEVVRTGVNNIAVVRAVTEAADVAVAVQQLRGWAG